MNHSGILGSPPRVRRIATPPGRELVSRPSGSRHNSRAGHPASRRCSSFRYSRYPRSSRLAIRAPRPGLMPRSTGTGHSARTGPRNSKHALRDVIVVGAGPAASPPPSPQPERPGLPGDREGGAGQFAPALSDRHGVLHHAGAAGDRRPAVCQPVRQADAAGSAALLPAGRRTRSSCDILFDEAVVGDRAGRRDARRRRIVRRRHAVGRAACAASVHARTVVLAMGYYDVPNARRSRRGPAARLALLHGAAPVLPAARRRRRRKEFGRRGRAGAVSRRRARDARPPARGARRLDQVLGAARHREPHQGRLDPRALRHARRRDSPDDAWSSSRTATARRCRPTRCCC